MLEIQIGVPFRDTCKAISMIGEQGILKWRLSESESPAMEVLGTMEGAFQRA